jgi:hypothetical protein
MLRPPFDPAAMPAGMRRLPLSPKGYPVPWFVDRRAPQRDGGPDFRIMDGRRLKLAIRERRCWVCGEPIRAPVSVFVAGPMCGINRTSSEPPCHAACADWSARACPFLTMPKRIRDDRDLPGGTSCAGLGITRNPGVTMLWTTPKYTTWRPPGGGLLFDLGEPSRVDWLCQGRPATRAEVVESCATGFPLLDAEAAKEGPAARLELRRMVLAFERWLPSEPEAPELEP